MKLLNITMALLALSFTTNSLSQSIKFRDSDQKIEVYRGATIEIKTDTAFIISKSRAALLNEKLDELKQARITNKKLQSINQELLDKVKEVEKLVSKLLFRMQKTDKSVEMDLSEIIGQLDASLIVMRENNQELAHHNSDLKDQINTLQVTIKTLKKEIRGIWWNGVVDKIAVGAAALVLGFFLGSVA